MQAARRDHQGNSDSKSILIQMGLDVISDLDAVNHLRRIKTLSRQQQDQIVVDFRDFVTWRVSNL